MSSVRITPANSHQNNPVATKEELGKQIRNLSRQTRETKQDNQVGLNAILFSSQSYAEKLREQRQQSASTVNKLKTLKYQYKDISSKIIRSKTASAARQAAGQARREVLRLKLEKQKNNDNSEELEAAIAHAKSMERIAKKKAKHLEEEEMAKSSGGLCSDGVEQEYDDFEENTSYDDELAVDTSEEEYAEEYVEEDSISELTDELVEELSDEMTEMLEDMGLSELLEAPSPEDMDPEDLKMMKIKHRNKEMKEIVKADADYLKVIFEQFEKAKSAGEMPASMSSDATPQMAQATPSMSGAVAPTINITL